MPPDANPDEDINESRICSPYIYEDGCTTGLRSLAFLPISIINNGISSRTMTNGCQSTSSNLVPRIGAAYNNFCNAMDYEESSSTVDNWVECPPPDYFESVDKCKMEADVKIDLELESEIPPPSYEDYLKSATDESAHHM